VKDKLEGGKIKVGHPFAECCISGETHGGLNIHGNNEDKR
jgi:hypothetical protein